MANINHVGKVISSGRKCLVAYRTLPGDAFNCLIIPTESLQDSYHDALVNLVETNAAQSAFEFAEVLFRGTFPDGSNMLVSLHAKGHLIKVPTDSIDMIPNNQTSIRLDELNHQIAQIRGVSVQDLAIRPDAPTANVQELAQVRDVPATKVEEQPLTDEQLAEKYRKDAARLLAEVNELNKMADQLFPKILIDPPASIETKAVEVLPIVKETLDEQALPEIVKPKAASNISRRSSK